MAIFANAATSRRLLDPFLVLFFQLSGDLLVSLVDSLLSVLEIGVSLFDVLEGLEDRPRWCRRCLYSR